MGGSGKNRSKGIDASAGELVWIRRRNGSWWPGQILDRDELPEGCVPAPKPAVPIKLLGRVDAIVDWYNLEKSKRVKAFRCAEFENCIEKAKSSALNLSKKASQYARRDDAILQALALESAGAEDEEHHHDESSSSFNSREESEDMDGNFINSEDDSYPPVPQLSQSGVSFEEPKRRGTANDSEDDENEGVKRTRGLEELGMGVAASTVKRKRSQLPQVCKFLKRKNRNRRLTKVLERTPDILVQDFTPADFSKFTSGASSRKQVRAAPQSSQGSHIDALSFGKEEHNGCNSTRSGTPDVHSRSRCLEKDTSGWPLQGKRNRRSRKMDMDEPHVAGVDRVRSLPHSSRNMDPNRIGGSLITAANGYPVKSRSMTEIQISEHFSWNWNTRRRKTHEKGSTAEMAAPQRRLPYRQSRFMVNPKYDSGEFSFSHHVDDPELHDVKMEVKIKYRREHVPYISLMSKINGRPIIGHPLMVEVLDEDSCDGLLNVSKLYSSSSEMDYNLGDVSGFQGGYKVYGRRPRGRPPQSSNAKPRKNGPSFKKIRKLSSLIDSDRPNHQPEYKPLVERIEGPSVACVPLKVVFSRLNAALR